MLKLLGKLKGVTLKSKIGDNNEEIHNIDLKLELVEGANRIQEILALLKQIVEVDLKTKQPTLN